MTLLLLDTTFLIAATAVAAGRTVVSADRRAFDGLPGVQAVDHRHP